MKSIDIRATILGTLAAISLVGGIVLAAIGEAKASVTCFGMVVTFTSYVVGLYSTPKAIDQ